MLLISSIWQSVALAIRHWLTGLLTRLQSLSIRNYRFAFTLCLYNKDTDDRYQLVLITYSQSTFYNYNCNCNEPMVIVIVNIIVLYSLRCKLKIALTYFIHLLEQFLLHISPYCRLLIVTTYFTYLKIYYSNSLMVFNLPYIRAGCADPFLTLQYAEY